MPFPECLDNWVDENNPVRVTDAFVDVLDLASIGMRQNVIATDFVEQSVEVIGGPPSLSRVTPSAAFEHSSELLGRPISRSCVGLELWTIA